MRSYNDRQDLYKQYCIAHNKKETLEAESWRFETMLKVEIYQKDERKEYDDVEKQYFDNVPGIEDTPVNRDILQKIEKGTYLNRWEFIDRFGHRVLCSDCCTGSKAAFLVANTDLTVDLAECGNNARDYILTHFNRGSVIIYESATPIAVDPVPVDIQYRNYHITKSSRLSHHLRYEFPWRPDLIHFPQEDQGIEVIDWKQPWGENGPEDRVVSMLLMLRTHPETVPDTELLHALETEIEATDLDWDQIRDDLWDSGVRSIPDIKNLPEGIPLAVRQCTTKMQKKDR